MRLILIFLFVFGQLIAQNNTKEIADSLFVMGKYSQAIKFYKALSLPSVNSAKSYLAIGNYNEAIGAYQQVLKQDSTLYSVQLDLAKLYADTKEYEKSKQLLLKLVYVDYKNPNYHYQLGKVHQNLNDEFSAQSRFVSAYKLDNYHQKALFELSKYQLRKSNFDKALEYAEKGLEIYPNNKSLISLKAQGLLFKEDAFKALKAFQLLYSLNENTDFVNDKLSLCYEKTSDYNNAIKYLKIVLENNKKDVSLLYRLAFLYERNKDFANASKYQAIALKQQDVSLENPYTKLAFYYNRQQKYKDALEAYQKALKEDPNNETINFYIVTTKLSYYKDLESKLKVITRFKKQFPASIYNKFLDSKESELKSEAFLKE
jgi:tetratricopeptide (TPR) repeat protein